MAKHSSTDNIANHSNTGKIANVSNTDRDEISILYIGPSIDASYQVAVHFAKRFQRRPIRNKNFLQQPCLLTDQGDE
jgi:hypothetical protein